MQAYSLFILCAVLATAYDLKPRGSIDGWDGVGGVSVDGGVGGVKKPDADVKKAVSAVIMALATQAKSDRKFARTKLTFEPIEYLTQAVAGTNYFVKIRVGPKQPGSPFVLARIYRGLDGKYRLDGFKSIKQSDQAAYMDGNINF